MVSYVNIPDINIYACKVLISKALKGNKELLDLGLINLFHSWSVFNFKFFKSIKDSVFVIVNARCMLF